MAKDSIARQQLRKLTNSVGHLFFTLRNLSASEVIYDPMDEESSATNVQEALDELGSLSALNNGGIVYTLDTWTDNGDGTLTLPNVEAVLTPDENWNSNYESHNIEEGTTGTEFVDLVDEDTNYIYVDYNGGLPQWAASVVEPDYNRGDRAKYLTLYRAGNFLHILDWDHEGSGLANKLLNRFYHTRFLERESGVALSLNGVTREVEITSGVVWNGIKRTTTSSVNSHNDTFFSNYHTAGVWDRSVSGPGSGLMNNSQYDDGTDRVLLGNNKYVVNWYYKGVESASHIYEVLGRGGYNNISEAQLESPPPVPELISSHTILVGRIIVQKDALIGIIESAFDVTFSPTQVTDHDDLTNVGERRHPELDEVYKFAVGSIVETIDVTVTEDTGTVYLNVEKLGGGDINLVFSTGIEVFDTTPIMQVALTTGTDVAPIENFIYILESTKALTVSTTGFPVVEHIPIAHTIIPSASLVASDGVYALHVWTDHTSLVGDNGHIGHINAWIRDQPATWISGVAPSYNITTNGGSLDNLDYAVTSGVVDQLHSHTYPAFDTGVSSNIYVVNDPTTAYKQITDLNTIDEDALGLTLRNNNDTSNLVIWGVASEDGSVQSKLFINLPTGKYTGAGPGAETAAIADEQQTANYIIPTSYRGTGFLIARLTVKYNVAGGGTLSVLQNLDLRGQLPTIAAGGVTPFVTEFFTSLFKLLDSADSSKSAVIDLTNIAAATERTIEMPDADVLLRKNNYGAAVVPDANDDSTTGYAVGSIWIDTTADAAYICLDSTATSAVWKKTTP